MKTTITNKETGENITLSRDVTTVHPQWVHDQCATSSEGELQDFLSQYSVSDFYESWGDHRGVDGYGITMSDGRMSQAQAEQWVRDHSDDDQLDENELEAAFTAIFEREPDDEDREQGLWSHLCAAVEAQHE